MLELAFLELGFSSNEVKLYMALLDGGKCGAHALTRRTGLPRTTVYSSLRTLEEKGLIAREETHEHLVFVARDPEVLVTKVQEDEQRLTQRRKAAKQLSEILKPFMKKGAYSVPQMTIFEGKRKVSNVLVEHFARWQASNREHDNTWWGFQDHTYVEQFKDALAYHFQKFHSEEQVRLFSNDAPIEKELRGKVKRREVRPFPFPVEFDGTLLASGDYLLFLQTRAAPLYLVEMIDAVLAKNVRGFFKAVWTLTGDCN